MFLFGWLTRTLGVVLLLYVVEPRERNTAPSESARGQGGSASLLGTEGGVQKGSLNRERAKAR